MTVARVAAFIDGFNLYHAIDALKQPHLKWVDLWALSDRFVLRHSEHLTAVYYFTAIAKWLPDRARRHKAYIAALQHRGVSPVLGNFKEKDHRCRTCGASWKGHEEKETDVNMALALVSKAFQEEYDRALVFTRDSDIAPAIRMARQLFPALRFTVISPTNKGHSSELVQAAHAKAKITVAQIESCLLPDLLTDAGGNVVARRPPSYDPPQ